MQAGEWLQWPPKGGKKRKGTSDLCIHAVCFHKGKRKIANWVLIFGALIALTLKGKAESLQQSP